MQTSAFVVYPFFFSLSFVRVGGITPEKYKLCYFGRILDRYNVTYLVLYYFLVKVTDAMYKVEQVESNDPIVLYHLCPTVRSSNEL